MSNQILGEILFRPSEKNDFGEYPIALITAERWAQKLSDEWELEYQPWDLIHCTDQVTSVIAEVYRIVSHPQKFNEYNQMHRNN